MTEPVVINTGDPILEEHYDAYENATAALETYTPSWLSSGTQPTLGDGTIAGRLRKVGLDTFVQVILTPGSTSTYGTGFYAFNLPDIANGGGIDAIGSARLFDTSTGTHYSATCVSPAGLNYIKMLFGSSGEVAPSVPFTWAAGDVIVVNIRVQA